MINILEKLKENSFGFFILVMMLGCVISIIPLVVKCMYIMWASFPISILLPVFFGVSMAAIIFLRMFYISLMFCLDGYDF